MGVAQRFRDAVEARDLDRMMSCFTDDVVFWSPVSHRPFDGPDAVRSVLSAVMATFEDFHYVDEAHGPHRSTLWFEARVGNRTLEGVDVLHHEPDDKRARCLTVMIRPRSALDVVAAAVGAHLLEAGR